MLFANLAADDRDDIGTGDRVMLIVENDLGFAKVLLEAARACGFKGIVTGTGASALTMTREFLPAVITLDIHLPDMEGWRILDRLKSRPADAPHPDLRGVSTDDARDRALQSGAIGFLAKPLQSADVAHAAIEQLARYVDRPVKRLAVVMPDSPLRAAAARQPRQRSRCRGGRQRRARRARCWPMPTAWWSTTRVADFGPEDVLDAMAERASMCQLPVVCTARRERPAEGQPRSCGTATTAASASARRLRPRRCAAYVAFWLHRSPGGMSEQDRREVEATLEGGHRRSRARRR